MRYTGTLRQTVVCAVGVDADLARSTGIVTTFIDIIAARFVCRELCAYGTSTLETTIRVCAGRSLWAAAVKLTFIKIGAYTDAGVVVAIVTIARIAAEQVLTGAVLLAVGAPIFTFINVRAL